MVLDVLQVIESTIEVKVHTKLCNKYYEIKEIIEMKQKDIWTDLLGTI